MNILNKWTDSHCHPHYSENIAEIMQNSAELAKILCVSTDVPDFQKLNPIMELDRVYQSIGIHPLSSCKHSLDEIKSYLRDAPAINLVAIGETGLDDYRNPLDAHQLEAFQVHIHEALDKNLPIIMHTRMGPTDSQVEIEAMKLIRENKVIGVAHCFGGSLDFAHFLLDHGWYISFAGNITYKKTENLHKVIQSIPQDRLLIETDAPFLTPEPYRGRPNEPIMVTKVGEKVANLLNLTYEEVMNLTYNNFNSLFANVINPKGS